MHEFEMAIDDDGGLKLLKKVDDVWDTNYVRNDMGYYLGDLCIRYSCCEKEYAGQLNACDDGICSAKANAVWTDINTRTSTRIINRTKDIVKIMYEGMGGCFSLEEIFSLADPHVLEWTIHICNTSDNDIAFGDIALPLPFNNDWDRDVMITQTLRTLPHFHISGNGSYAYVTRVNGEGPYLVMFPAGKTSLEFFTNNKPNGDHDGLTTVYIHSGATGQEMDGTWRQPHTSRVLKAGEPVCFKFIMKWADSFEGVHDLLYENGLVDVEVTPGMVIPADLKAKVAIRCRKPIHFLAPEYPSETKVTPISRKGEYQIYEFEFGRLGENKIVIDYGDSEKTQLEYFATKPLESLLESRYSFLARNQQVKIDDPELDNIVEPTMQYWDGVFNIWNMQESQKGLPVVRRFGLEGYHTSGSDDPGLSKPAALAQFNAIKPDQQQIDALEYYAEHFLWGKAQRSDIEVPYPYAIHGGNSWWDTRHSTLAGTGIAPVPNGLDPFWNTGGHGRDRVWRAYDYCHVFMFWYNMHLISHNYPDMVRYCDADEYLRRSYITAVAFIELTNSIFMHHWDHYGFAYFGTEMGCFNESVIPEIINAVETKGNSLWPNGYPHFHWLSEENTRMQPDWTKRLRLLWENKVKYFIYDHKYPFGSEMKYDTTAFECTHAMAKYAMGNNIQSDNGIWNKNLNDHHGGNSPPHIVQRADIERFMERQILANKATREIMAPNYSQLGSDMRGPSYNLSYGTPMGAYGLLDYAEYHAKCPANEMRLAYSAYLALYCLINTGDSYPWWGAVQNEGALAWAFQTQKIGPTWPGFKNERGPWKFDGENDYGLGTVVRIAAAVVVDDPVFGLIAYGGQLSRSGSLSVLVPRDGIRQRIHILASPHRLHFHLDRDAFKSISYKEDASEINFELEHRTEGAHNTTITLQNLPELSYDVYINNEMTGRFVANNNETLLVLSLPSEAETKVKLLETCVDTIICDAGTGC